VIVSIVTRKTSVGDREQWRQRLEGVLPALKAVLEAEAGFLGVEYLWGAENDGLMAQITRWQTLEDCQRYVRGGAAATVALQEDRAIPTAPHPDGAWVRRTFEVAG
jgi:heme-degrading monooxygenase HmoA